MRSSSLAVGGAARTAGSGFELALSSLLTDGYRLACAMLHDPQAAEDAVQEAAVKAWRKQHRLRVGAELRPWFLGIVANQCRSTRRMRWWSEARWLPELAADGPGDEVAAGVDLRRALRRLDHRKRLALVMYWYLDLPVEDIAVATGSSVHAVETRLRRGITELRRRLGRSDD
jgi:RNA polymerase sigma-70 factor, ECF subfamily